MDECCKVSAPQVSSQPLCPRCGEVGRVVADETIQAILKRGAATPLLALERRFCKTRSCKVLYYGADGRFVEKGAAVVRIGVKETEDPIPLCYCFNFSRADVQREVAEAGSSSIPARITAEVKAGRCACEVKNPSGACCLGEVNKAVKDARETIFARRQSPWVSDSIS
jgi:hypothetical protein